MLKFLENINYTRIGGYLITAGITLIVAWILRKIVSKAFKKINEKQKSIYFTFLEKFVKTLIIIGAILVLFSALEGTQSIWKSLLGGTAVISAVIAFAAQDVLKDVLAGFMISFYKPFEIGDRIELENGITGVVEDITMRHVVIITIDSIRAVVPNRKINETNIINYKFNSNLKSVHFKFNIDYKADIEKAKKVVCDVVKSSKYAVPGKIDKKGEMVYAPVYFLNIDTSSLVIGTTVYFDSCPTEVIKDEINTSVMMAFKENNIEIPYDYINVINTK